MFRYIIFFCSILMFCLDSSSVSATLSAEERAVLHESLVPMWKDCLEELEITPEQVKEMKEKKAETMDIFPCLLNCMFKKIGMFDDGIFDVDKSLKYSKIYLTNDEELARIDEVRHECLKVNEAEITDGEEACERAMMLFKCLKELKDDLVLYEDE